MMRQRLITADNVPWEIVPSVRYRTHSFARRKTVCSLIFHRETLPTFFGNPWALPYDDIPTWVAIFHIVRRNLTDSKNVHLTDARRARSHFAPILGHRKFFRADRRLGSSKALFRRIVQLVDAKFRRFYALPRRNTLLNTRVHLLLRHDVAHNRSALESRTELLPSTLHPHPTYRDVTLHTSPGER